MCLRDRNLSLARCKLINIIDLNRRKPGLGGRSYIVCNFFFLNPFPSLLILYSNTLLLLAIIDMEGLSTEL